MGFGSVYGEGFEEMRVKVKKMENDKGSQKKIEE